MICSSVKSSSIEDKNEDHAKEIKYAGVRTSNNSIMQKA